MERSPTAAMLTRPAPALLLLLVFSSALSSVAPARRNAKFALDNSDPSAELHGRSMLSSSSSKSAFEHRPRQAKVEKPPTHSKTKHVKEVKGHAAKKARIEPLQGNGTQLEKAAKIGQPKQSWLAVASAVAHSTAADTGSQTAEAVPVGGGEETGKPTKYHYYPHNQHLYLLPECATQQVCSAVYLRLNYSQPLCACPNFHEPCSVSTRTDDRHTIPLVTGTAAPLTLVKTCEPTNEVRECRAPKDWSILALQNSRTGKAHYLVICRCPSPAYLEGPIAHSQPAYARVPGIRVYGMTCVRTSPRSARLINSKTTNAKEGSSNPPFPWNKLKALFKSVGVLS